MRITVICVGRLKEKYLAGAQNEYLKRLTRYCKPELIEVKDEKIPERYSAAQQRQAVETEGRRIISHLRRDQMIIAMDIGGKLLSSTDLAVQMGNWSAGGRSDFCFIIGGSCGLSQEVLKKADLRLSFSPMTFPHQLFRIMLLEQLYRVFKINSNEIYHK
jgi:23S rRNA (pseudouridine1915-N3)-methyltransferase